MPVCTLCGRKDFRLDSVFEYQMYGWLFFDMHTREILRAVADGSELLRGERMTDEYGRTLVPFLGICPECSKKESDNIILR